MNLKTTHYQEFVKFSVTAVPAQTTNSILKINGYTSEILQTKDGQFELNTPRYRGGSFEPELVKKNQRYKFSMCQLISGQGAIITKKSLSLDRLLPKDNCPVLFLWKRVIEPDT